MLIIYILTFTTIIISLSLPLRHIRSKYFYYFLILGITNFVSLILYFIFNLQSNSFSLLLTIFLPFSLFYNFFKKNLLLLFIFFLIVTYPIVQIDAKTSLLLQHPFDVAVVFILLWQNSKTFLKENFINLFSFSLLLYALAEFLALIGFIVDINTDTSVIINYIAVFSQIIIGIFLLIFSEDNPKVIFRVSK